MPRRKKSHPMELTESNYYSAESNQIFFSVSQYKDLMRCEAAAMARIRGEYEPPLTRALLVGSFVDSYIEGSLERFKDEHPEVFTLKEELRAEFRRANEVIKRIESSNKFMAYLSGEKQKILTFEMFGVPWKIKMDSFIEGKCIVDLKTAAKMEWLPRQRYELQGAVYQAGTDACGYGKLPFYLAVATKEKIPDLGIFQIPQSMLDMALQEIGENMPHLIEVKAGLIAPKRCEKCPYCRATREIKVRDYRELLEG